MEAGTKTHAADEGGRSFIESLAERLGQHLSSTTIYGEPVERGGVTVITVARARMGFGGGSGGGTGADGVGEGAGGGGGVVVSPVGYIEVTSAGSTFRRIVDPASLLPVILAGALAGLILLRGLRELVR